MSGWAAHGSSNKADQQMQFALLEEKILLLESELRDTNKKVRSKLDFLLKRIQDLEEKSVDNT